MTCGERWKVPLIGGFRSCRFSSLPVAFRCRAGIEAGSPDVRPILQC